MARKSKQELNALAVENGVKTLWSWSRYHCYKQDTFEYLLRYILKKKEDKPPSIYGVAGGAAHDILEKFYGGEIEYGDMLPCYEEQLLLMQVDELKFNTTDADANLRTAQKYEECVRHFFAHHQPLPKPYLCEEFVVIRINETIVLQGYIDFMHIETQQGERHLFITDFKTSTAYKGKKVEQESGQLLLYVDGLRQKSGLPLSHIHAGWNFLKYVNATVTQANGAQKVRQIERNQIGAKLATSIRMWCKKSPAAYSEAQIEDFIARAIGDNTLTYLPPEVQDKFHLADCIVEIPVTEQAIVTLKEDIAATVAEINQKQAEYAATGNESLFWQDVTDADSFRLANLTGYSRHLHKPYDAYLKERELFEDSAIDDDMEFMEMLEGL